MCEGLKEQSKLRLLCWALMSQKAVGLLGC
jgi:hypothetical protein